MHTFRWRSNIMRWTAATILVLAAVVFAAIWGRTEEVQPRLLIDLPWKQAGINPSVAVNGALYGPRTFAIGPNGSIYIADSDTKTIFVFDSEGRLLSKGTVPVPGNVQWDDMSVASDGRIYLVNNAAVTIDVIDVPGERAPRLNDMQAPEVAFRQNNARYLATIRTEASEQRTPAQADVDSPDSRQANDARVSTSFARIEAAAPYNSGQLYFVLLEMDEGKYARKLYDIKDWQRKPELVMQAEVVPFQREPNRPLGAMFHTMAVSANGDVVLDVSSGGTFDRQIVRIDRRDGMPYGPMTIKQERWVRSFELLGIDRKGAIYTGIELGTSEGHIRKYDSEGKLVWQVAAPQKGQIRTNTWARVDRHGDIYLLKLDERGLQVEKWQRTVKWKLWPERRRTAPQKTSG